MSNPVLIDTAEISIGVHVEELPEGTFFVATANNGEIDCIGKARSKPMAVAFCLQKIVDSIKSEVYRIKRESNT